MILTVNPCDLKNCRIRIPAGKSESHRVIITASLAKGVSRLSGISESEDIAATISCMKKLGADFQKDGNDLYVRGIRSFADYGGEILDCGESGSTLRFLIPLFSLTGKQVIFKGHGKLMQRPQEVYRDIFTKQGLLFDKDTDTLTMQGPLKPGMFDIRGDISSQFISGLLMTLPLLSDDSVLNIIAPFESKPYVRLTVAALERAKIKIETEDRQFRVKGGQTYKPFSASVKGDDSQAVFFAVLSAISGITINADNLAHDSLQGDHAFIDIMIKAGLSVKETSTGYVFAKGSLKPLAADLADIPDLGPALFALATQCPGTSSFYHCGRLRLKESDRLASMETELRKLGCRIYHKENTVYVEGKTDIQGGVRIDGHNDHRIVMALAVLAAIAHKPVEIEGIEAINKSYPDFLSDLEKTGAIIELC